MQEYVQYDYEHIFIDNASSDATVAIIKELALTDPHLKLIVNARNYGHIRSPHHAFLQTKGDCVISIVCDLQDPPHLIRDFITMWEGGAKIVVAIKESSEESKLMYFLRGLFYSMISKISDTKQIEHFTGFGLYDKSFIDVIRGIDDPYPYFRGLVTELGFGIETIVYKQPQRHGGKTKNNFYTLYDMAMLGFVSYSKVPLRLSSFIGFVVSIVSIIIAMVYLGIKLARWDEFELGLAPLIIGMFFFSGIQLFFLGVIGEYIGAIFTQVKKRPLVTEKERINF